MHVVFDRTHKEGDVLDPYSKTKLRWYSEESGGLHREEITRRKFVDRNGERIPFVVDSKGRLIDELPVVQVTGKKMGTKANLPGGR